MLGFWDNVSVFQVMKPDIFGQTLEHFQPCLWRQNQMFLTRCRCISRQQNWIFLMRHFPALFQVKTPNSLARHQTFPVLFQAAKPDHFEEMLGNIPAVFVATTSNIFDKKSEHFQLHQWEQTGGYLQDMWWQKTDIFEEMSGHFQLGTNWRLLTKHVATKNRCLMGLVDIFSLLCDYKTWLFLMKCSGHFPAMSVAMNSTVFDKTSGHFQPHLW